MYSITLWILLTPAANNRPPIVIDNFSSEQSCLVVAEQVWEKNRDRAACIKATVLRYKI